MREAILGKGRLEALADGIFAISMTLLVLDIRVPDLDRHASVADIGHALAKLGPNYFAFLVSFFLAGAFWMLHHRTFHFLKGVNRRLMLINLLFLMFVAVLPFSTGVMARFLGNPWGPFVYFTNLTLVAGFLVLHWRRANSTGLVDTATEAIALQRTSGHIHARFFAALASAAMAALGFLLPVSQLSFFVFLFWMLIYRLRERREMAAMQPRV